MKHIKIVFFLFLTLLTFSCTKLDESFRSELEQNTSSTITPAQILTTAYNELNGPFQQGDFWHVQEHTSDEVIAPTRGPDWDDNGQWRALHAHTWNADQGQIRGAFNGLLRAQFAASNVLQFNPSPQQAAEARFLRAFTMFAVLDGYDQVPYREDLTDYKKLPETLKGIAAADFITGELNAIISNLPDAGVAYVANKNAARALLMKLHLNKGVYANRAAPTFDAADMNQVITLADQIIGTNKYSLNDIFYDNFAPDNDVKSKENIFTLYNQGGERGGQVRGYVFQVNHYNMNPSGWNGFATLSDFYDKFEAADQRRGMYYTYPGALPNPGHRQNVGFLIGQQYDLTTDAALKDRKGNPLSFTREVSLRETGNDLEITGIRVIKYPYDYATSGDQKNNDYAIFRYADVLLMKAEALLRTGKEAEALAIVNQIRAKRLATPLTSINLDQFIDERGREMYYEGWRRQDLIRFGKFLQPWQQKEESNPRNLLFPIPSDQLAVNPNLTQNPGY
jgi:starch-binding outer membrane protein, SusD/RagB family